MFSPEDRLVVLREKLCKVGAFYDAAEQLYCKLDGSWKLRKQ